MKTKKVKYIFCFSLFYFLLYHFNIISASSKPVTLENSPMYPIHEKSLPAEMQMIHTNNPMIYIYFGKVTTHNKKVFQDIFIYQNQHLTYMDEGKHLREILKSIEGFDISVLKIKDRIQINHCAQAPYLTINNMGYDIPFNCNGFFVNPKKTVKIGITKNQHIIGTFFIETNNNTMSYLSLTNGSVYTQNLQNTYPNFNWKGKPQKIVGYRILTDPSALIGDDTGVSDCSQYSRQYYDETDDTFTLPIPVPGVGDCGQYSRQYYDETDVPLLYLYDETDDTFTLPIPVPGVGDCGQHSRQYYDETDDTFTLPIPVPGVGDCGQYSRQYYDETDVPLLYLYDETDDTFTLPIPVPGVGDCGQYYDETNTGYCMGGNKMVRYKNNFW